MTEPRRDPPRHVTRIEPVEDYEESRRGTARERMQRRRDVESPIPAMPKPDWSWGIIAAAIVGVVILVSVIMAMTGGSQAAQSPTWTAAPLALKTLGPAAPVINIQPWDGKKRFTVLLLGIDKRPGEEGTGFRTDSMVLVSVDPATKSIGMLSIPRDLYVPIPGQADLQRINTAYVIGELDQPGNGPKLALQTVQYNFGIQVNGYVVVTFESVIGLVDAIGGIDINVPQAIDDPEYPDMNYGYDPLHIPAGNIHMDGQLALKYARTRHQSDDYDRADRQQQVILAIRQKVVQPTTITSLVGQAPQLWGHLSGGFITNFTVDQALSLGWFLKDIPSANIHRATLNNEYVQAMQYQGDSIVVPNRNLLSQIMTQTFGPNYDK